MINRLHINVIDTKQIAINDGLTYEFGKGSFYLDTPLHQYSEKREGR